MTADLLKSRLGGFIKPEMVTVDVLSHGKCSCLQCVGRDEMLIEGAGCWRPQNGCEKSLGRRRGALGASVFRFHDDDAYAEGFCIDTFNGIGKFGGERLLLMPSRAGTLGDTQ